MRPRSTWCLFWMPPPVSQLQTLNWWKTSLRTSFSSPTSTTAMCVWVSSSTAPRTTYSSSWTHTDPRSRSLRPSTTSPTVMAVPTQPTPSTPWERRCSPEPMVTVPTFPTSALWWLTVCPTSTPAEPFQKQNRPEQKASTSMPSVLDWQTPRSWTALPASQPVKTALLCRSSVNSELSGTKSSLPSVQVSEFDLLCYFLLSQLIVHVVEDFI